MLISGSDAFNKMSGIFELNTIIIPIILICCGIILSFRGLYAARRYSRTAKAAQEQCQSNLLLLAAPDDAASAIDAEVGQSLRENGVAVASLEAILARFRKAGIPEPDIPGRLRAVAETLAMLRSRLSRVDDGDSGEPLGRMEALAFIDSGDLDAARRAMRRAFEESPSKCEDRRREAVEIRVDAALLDHLRLDYLGAAENYAVAATFVTESAGQGSAGPDRGAGDAWRLRMDQARELCCDGCEFGNAESLHAAIEIYQSALDLVRRADAPLDWAKTQFQLGDALLASAAREPDLLQLERAVDAYLAALEEWTREAAPSDWAKAQNNLGEALQSLAENEGGITRLEPAVEAHRAALEEWTREADPILWAIGQGNLGDALVVMGARTGAKEPLREAIVAYRSALEEITRAVAPLDWAMMQNNLGNALEALGAREGGADLLRQAVEAYKAALEEQTRERAPSAFAATSSKLGDALLAVGERLNNPEMLGEAAEAYRAALAARSEESASLETGMIRINLAYALGALWSRTRNPQALDEAIVMLDEAIAAFRDAGEGQQLSDAELARKSFIAAARQAA